MRRHWMLWFAAALGLTNGAAAVSRADTFYVATDGDDASGDGSTGNPWATVTHAINQAIPASGGHEVVVRDGTYVGTAYLSRAFDAEVVVRAEHPYRAKLTNVTGENEALRVYVEGPARVTFEGFVISNAHESYGCPNGRESYYLIHLQDASEVTLRNNVIFGNNAPGRCNELLKINRGTETAYPRDIVVQGNLFYDPANAGGSDMIDSVRPGELDIVDNIFMGSASHPESQSFITVKRQVQTPPPDARSPRFVVARNVFLEFNGHSDQAFVQFGEDGYAEYMVTDALVENNLVIGNSAAPLAAPFQWKGSQQIVTRANTVVGDLPGGSYGFRIGTEEENPPVAGFGIFNNIWSDPTGTMGTRLVNSYGDVDNGSVALDFNLFWNGGSALPAEGDVAITTDAHRIEADPGLPTDQSGLVMPRWDESAGSFPSGSTTIREEFLRLVESYGAIPATSPAADAADPSNMPAADIRNLARDATPDVGAYEVGATAGAGGGGVGGGWGGTPDVGGASAGGAGTGATGTGGSAANPPGGADAAATEEEGGCGCRVAARGPTGAWPALTTAALACLAARRRTRRRLARGGSIAVGLGLLGSTTATLAEPAPLAAQPPQEIPQVEATPEPSVQASAPPQQGHDERQAALALYQRGQELFAAKKYPAALEAFLGADRIMGVPTTGLEVARTRAKLGLLLGARNRALEAARHPTEPGEPASFAPARQQAATLAKEIAARIPTVRFEVMGPTGSMTQESRVDVRFDGRVLEPARRAVPLEVDPGAHVVEVTAPGFAVERGSLTLQEREQRIVQVTLEPEQAVELAEAPGISPAVYAGFGVGGACLVAGAITGGLTLSAASELEEECPGKQCPMGRQGELQDARTLGNVSTALFIVGGLGLGVGLSSLLMSLRGEEGEETEVAASGEGSIASAHAERSALRPRAQLVVGLGTLGAAGTF